MQTETPTYASNKKAREIASEVSLYVFLFLCTHGNNLRKVKLSQWYNISKLAQKSKCVIVSDIVFFFNKHSEIVSDKSTFKLDIDLVSLSEK